MSDALFCTHASVCSGCDWIEKAHHEQVQLKQRDLETQWNSVLSDGPQLPSIRWVEVASGGLRDRADLMIDTRGGSYKLGLFSRDRSGIADLSECPQMSLELEAWLKEFRKVQIPVQRGSIRLRVAPTGLRGVWLDLANVDVKKLLDERSVLDQLRSMAVVEIGQRRKRLVEREGQLKLADPVFEPWFETYIETPANKEQPVSLYCSIGSFTQPGFKANRALIGEVRKLLSVAIDKTKSSAKTKTAVEFGSGIGNFTLPLASLFDHVHAYEVDRLATEGLRRSLTEHSLETKVTIHEGNYQAEQKATKKHSLDFANVDLVLVDPPRSGLMNFLNPLESLSPHERPSQFLYVSCFAESFVADSARLIQMGYEPHLISIVNQFPQSRHYEIVALFQRRGEGNGND